MRYHYLQAFQHILIDNLNGDKYRTGKSTPEGKPDPSAFSTPQNREGIQVGTAIATLVRSSLPAETPIEIRDLWGSTKLALLDQESRQETTPTYVELTPKPALGNPFAARVHAADYTSWPRLPELFPHYYPGVKTIRDQLLTDIDRDQLEKRIKSYLDPNYSNEDIAAISLCSMENTAKFDAKITRQKLTDKFVRQWKGPMTEAKKTELQSAAFRPWQVMRYAYRPFDVRWLYWEPTTDLLDRKREDYLVEAMIPTHSLVAQQTARGKAGNTQVISSFGCLDLMDRGATYFPIAVFSSRDIESSPSVTTNLSVAAIGYISNLGVAEEHIFYHSLAMTYADSYRTENVGALLGDWPRIPLPATAELLTYSASLGRRLAELLDPESDLQLIAEWSFLARLVLPQPSNLAENLKLTAGWGSRGQGSTVMPGRGKSEARPWTEIERERLTALAAAQSLSLDHVFTLLGESCFDIYLNGATLWTAVPANVWSYTLGGYQVLKKWLSYRELPLLGRALRPDESDYFAQVVRRIAAILLFGPALDASYQAILPTATGLAQQ